MFTGIIKDKGYVVAVDKNPQGQRLQIRTTLPLAQIEIGASVACDGCCLTVVEKGADGLAFDVGPETLAKTTLGSWAEGAQVNLEASLRLGDEMGGHMVSGHVDGVATVESVVPEGDSWRLKIRVPSALASYIAPKGSVALNGISLTVNEVDGDMFGVCIIPHTWQVTTISNLKSGDFVNLEVDMMARYVARILGARILGKEAA